MLVLFQSCYPSSPCPLQLHMPHHHTPPSCMHPIATPLPATWAMLLHPSQLHVPFYCAPPSHTCHLTTSPHISQPYRPCCHAPSSSTGYVTSPLLAAQATLPHPCQLHALYCHPLPAAHATLLCHIATPLIATHAMLLHPSQVHMSHHCPSCSHTHHVTTPSYGHMHHITMPPAAICTISLCPS